MALRKFNPKRIVGSFNGKVGDYEFAIKFQGYMDGSFIKAQYAEDAVTEHVGSQGEITIVLNANKLASVTVTFGQGSPSNDALSLLIPDGARNYLPVGQLAFSDLNGTSKIKSAEAWLRTVAPVEFGNQVTAREWVFGLADAEIVVGGAGDF